MMMSGNSYRSQTIALTLLVALLALWKDTAPVVVLAQSSDDNSSSSSTSFVPRCGVQGQDAGACWCIPSGGISTADACPSISPGIRQTFPTDWSVKLNTFRLVANISASATSASPRPAISPPALTASTTGSESPCYAFATAVGKLDNFPESEYPQCVFPMTPAYANGTTATAPVCAYKYDSRQACRGRDYQMITYVDKAAADAAGADMVHTGPCGVCSTAQDLAARMSTLPQFNPLSIICGANYFSSQSFSGLVKCYEGFGFSTPCATLWAQFSATSTRLCTSECTPVNNVVALNEPAPTCSLAPCTQCSTDKFETPFNSLAGVVKSAYNAGFNDDIAYPCSSYTRIDNLDPCQDALPTAAPAPTMAPAGAPTQSSAVPRVTWNVLESTTQLSATTVLFYSMLLLGVFV